MYWVFSFFFERWENKGARIVVGKGTTVSFLVKGGDGPFSHFPA